VRLLRGSGEHGWCVAGLGTGLCLLFHVQIAAGGAAMQTNPKDSRHLHAVLEWGHRCLSGAPECASVRDPPIFYPATGAAAWSDSLLGLLPLYSPARWLGVEPATAWQALAVLIAALDYVAAWFLLRSGAGFGGAAAMGGAWIFAFAAPRAAKLNHPHLAAGFPMVLAVLLFARLCAGDVPERRRRAYAVAIPLLLAWQFWCSVYLGAFAVLVGALVLACGLPSARFRRSVAPAFRKSSLGWLAGIALAGLTLAPLVLAYAGARREVPISAFADVESFLPRPVSWIHPGTGAWFDYGLGRLSAVADLEPESAHRLGWGLLAPALALAGMWLSRRDPRWRAIALGSLAAVILVTPWPGGFTFWRFVFDFVPGMQALRAVGRISLVLLLPAGAFVALALERIASRVPRAALLAGLALVALEQGRTLPSYPKERFDSVANAIAASVEPGCAAFYVAFREIRPAEVAQLDAVWGALFSARPTVNGYAGYTPATWAPLADAVVESDVDRRRLAEALRRWLVASGVEPSTVCWIEEQAGVGGGRRFAPVSSALWPPS
jgi:hypothetical protein